MSDKPFADKISSLLLGLAVGDALGVPVEFRPRGSFHVTDMQLDEDGDYFKETDMSINDNAYWLHYSESGATLGCIRLGSAADAEKLGMFIEGVLKTGEQIQLEVV